MSNQSTDINIEALKTLVKSLERRYANNILSLEQKETLVAAKILLNLANNFNEKLAAIEDRLNKAPNVL